MLSWTSSRSTEQQAWPPLNVAPQTIAEAVNSRSASARTTSASTPPSSSPTGTGCAAAAAITRRPVATDPVNRTLSGRASTSAAPRAPSPTATWRRPAGRPASWTRSPISRPTSGVSSDGLSTTALPASSAGRTWLNGMKNGKFHGAIATTTPYGRWWRTAVRCGRFGSRMRASPKTATARSRWCRARATVGAASWAIASAVGLPFSRWMTSAIRSRLSASTRGSSASTRTRSATSRSPHAG